MDDKHFTAILIDHLGEVSEICLSNEGATSINTVFDENTEIKQMLSVDERKGVVMVVDAAKEVTGENNTRATEIYKMSKKLIDLTSIDPHEMIRGSVVIACVSLPMRNDGKVGHIDDFTIEDFNKYVTNLNDLQFKNQDEAEDLKEQLFVAFKRYVSEFEE